MGEVRFMISEAAKQVRVESHVLRYWEEELDLDIGRTEMGHRYYTKEDIQLFRCIKKLKNEGILLRDLKPLVPELKSTKDQILLKQKPKPSLSSEESLNSPEQPNTFSESVAQNVSSEDSHLSCDISQRSSSKTSTLPCNVSHGIVTEAEVLPFTQLDQARKLIGDVLNEVITANNQKLESSISKKVTSDVLREMEYLFQAKERQEEEHFRKLDCLIRQQQASRKEAARESAFGKLLRNF